jgi:hypothetical protein
MVESCEAARDALYTFQILDWSHVCDGRDLLRIRFNAAFGHDKAKEHARAKPLRGVGGCGCGASTAWHERLRPAGAVAWKAGGQLRLARAGAQPTAVAVGR